MNKNKEKEAPDGRIFLTESRLRVQIVKHKQFPSTYFSDKVYYELVKINNGHTFGLLDENKENLIKKYNLKEV